MKINNPKRSVDWIENYTVQSAGISRASVFKIRAGDDPGPFISPKKEMGEKIN
jgi:hypothetical protein